MEALSLLIIFPAGALLIGVAFLVIAFLRKKKIPAFVGTMWLLYGVYEYLMYTRVLCTGECNIRIDLLLIYPVLMLATVIGLISAVWRINLP